MDVSKRFALQTCIALPFISACARVDRAPGQAVGAAGVTDVNPSIQVADTERAFARTMATRDLSAFSRFLADEAIFFGSDRPLRGKAAITEAWSTFFEGREAPFSWSPETVEVLASGQLAQSSGPVYDTKGQRIGSFNSVWRRQASGIWQIIFDNGCSCVAH